MADYTKWGPKNGVDSKDYILFKQGDAGVTDKPINLLGHSVGAPSPNLVDALVFTDVEFANGQVRAVERVKRAAYESSRTYSIGIPSTLLTPVIEQSYKGCEATFFLKYVCPEDRIYSHFDVLPDGYLSPAVEAEDLVTNGTETNPITMTSELRVPKKLRGYVLGYGIQYTIANTISLNDIAFNTVECVGCNEGIAQKLSVVGGDGTAIPLAVRTNDRFASVSTETTTGLAAEIGQALFTEGTLKIVTTRTGATLAAATAGDLYISNDNGATYATVAAVVEVITRIIRVGNVLIAVGKDATKAHIAISSDNGASWVSVSNTLLQTGDCLMDVSYDPTTLRIYFVGTGSVFLVGRLNGATLQLTNLFANLPATAPAAVHSVKVLGKNNLLVGGASGYLVESRDGGLTFSKVISGSSATVNSIDGNQYRAVIAAGDSLYARDFMSDNKFQKITLENGEALEASSVINRVVMAPEGDMNRFVACTSKGQVVFSKPFYPGA